MSKHRGGAVGRRINLMAMAVKRGIPLHCEGGRGYGRDLRRLVRDGFGKLVRSTPWGGWAGGIGTRRTSFVLTDEGRTRAKELGLEPPPAAPKPPMKLPVLIPEGDRRRVLDGHRRVEVGLLREQKTGEVLPPDTTKDPDAFAVPALVVKSWRVGERVYHWPQTIERWVMRSEPMIEAGRLRRTGRGLVLDRHITWVLRAKRRPSAPILAEKLRRLKEELPTVSTQVMRVPETEFFFHCRTDAEAIALRMLLPEVTLFKDNQ